MGMAASQARYLALVARKSNCEYEGQQINEARTALSNQSANLFNQMLGLNVPVPPSTQDYTKTQYSYSDGFNSSTISSWQQLSNADPDYNYVVTHHYYTDRYTGSMKMLSDPQVQFTSGAVTRVEDINAALLELERTYNAYVEAKAIEDKIKAEANDISNYASSIVISSATYTYDPEDGRVEYGIDVDNDPANMEMQFIPYNQADLNSQVLADDILSKLPGLDLSDEDVLSKIFIAEPNAGQVYVAFEDDLKALNGVNGAGELGLPIYNMARVEQQDNYYKTNIRNAETATQTAWKAYKDAESAYEALSVPTYIGNCELDYLTTLDKDQEAELKQIIADLEKDGIDANILDCFDPNGNYKGGIYSFKLNGITYYTTYADLENSYETGIGNNNIDGQIKMAYYNATYISTKIEETEKALLETDGNGRFVSVRFENDSVTYVLNMETVTDDAAYQDAMNEYYYANALYDKMVQDINAKTSIIHQQDQQLELRLKQLDTEQKALSTEMEAVKKVVDDNVEKSFKTFNG